jgi:hypothetical protein
MWNSKKPQNTAIYFFSFLQEYTKFVIQTYYKKGFGLFHQDSGFCLWSLW